MDFLELSKNRYAVLHYQEKPVPDDLLRKIVEAGVSAPTACNLQPQKIRQICSDADKEKLNRVVPSRYYVPAAFLVCYDKTKCWTRKLDGKSSGEIDAAIVTTHMMMEAASLGLGSIWVMYWNPDTMKSEFELPPQYEPVALLIVGYADKRIAPHKEHFIRKPIEEVMF